MPKLKIDTGSDDFLFAMAARHYEHFVTESRGNVSNARYFSCIDDVLAWSLDC